MKNRKKYTKVAYKSTAPLLVQAVNVMQNLPGHCIASVRQSTHGVDIESVRNRCMARWEQIQRIQDAVNQRTYRKTEPQFPPQEDLDSALDVAHNVYLWLSQWDGPVASTGEDRVYQDPIFISYHDVTHNEREDTGGRDSAESGFGADTAHNDEWN